MLKIISGNSNPKLAEEITSFLGKHLTPVTSKSFADGENYVKIEESIRGHDVFIIQSICCPPNDNLMELLLLIDACKRASAKSVSAVIPYYAYARQDRKAKPREAISAKLIANLLQTAGADRVLTVDLHTRQIQGFFDIPTDDLWAAPVLRDYFENKKLSDLVIVSPDAGGVPRARHMGKLLNAPIAVIDKRRKSHNDCEVMKILGDVKGKNAIIFDDMIDTGGTISKASKAIKDGGAKNVFICATHGVLSNDAKKKLTDSPATEIVLTNTIPLENEGKLKIVSVAPLLGLAIKNIYNKESVSALGHSSLQLTLSEAEKITEVEDE